MTTRNRSASPIKIAAVVINLLFAGAMLAGCSTADDDPSSGRDSANTGGASTSSTGSSKDALNYPQVDYTFSCAGVPGTKSMAVSDGPCRSKQQVFAKAVSCNEYDADFTFKSKGKPFYQCLVDNTTDSSAKNTYQKNLDFYAK